jgi:hypothetical protein
MRRALATLTVLFCTTAFATACGGEDGGDISTEPTSTVPNSTEATSPDPASSDTASSEPTETAAGTQQIEVTFAGDSVTPNGERVEVAVGEPVELVVTADAPGEIHVHSSPEQELEYRKGTTTIELDPIQRPGVVEVESHTLEKTIVQLEAR